MSRSLPAYAADGDTPLDRVEELLEQCLAEPEDRWDEAIEASCRHHPDHAATLRRRFAALRAAGLGPATGSRDADLRLVRDLAVQEPEIAHALAQAVGVDAASIPGAPVDGRLNTALGGRYELRERLGAGAMGVVYRGFDRELRRDVAVKLLDPTRFADARAEARFAQEAELLASLRHEAVVAIFDRGRSEGDEPFVVMELVEGAPLTCVLQAVADGHTTPTAIGGAIGARLAETSYVRQVARWGAELAEGLAAAHAHDILHRDVKPSNVFVRTSGRAVLLDFGIATRGGNLTAEGSVLGTPWYMAPEQASADAKLTPALDVYGLCSCLYHLLCGKPPFEGAALTVLATLQRQDPPRLSVARPDLPADLRAIVEVGMSRSPGDRYADGAALARDLRAFLAHEPVSARPLSLRARVWRRIKRQPARAALAIALPSLLVLGMALRSASLREAQRVARERKAVLEAALPGELAFEGDPAQRLLAVVRPEHEGHIAELDELIQLAPDDLPSRLWRAALALDTGRHDAAARDLDELARRADTPYLRAVAARYAQANRAEAGTLAVSLTDLGVAPETPADCFVAGFHELRNRHVPGFAPRAFDLLGRAKDSYLPARDLYLLATLVRADYASDAKAQRALLEQAVEDSLRLEGTYGRATARTLAVRGAALVYLNRPRDGIEALQRALELRPNRHGPLQNLAVAHRDLGDLAKASEFIARAHAVRPHFWNTGYLRAQILLDAGEFAAAREVAGTLSDAATAGPGAAWKKPYLLANIDIGELFALCADGADLTAAPARRTALAEQAHVNLELARSRGAPADAIEARRSLSRALASDDREAASTFLLEQLVSGREDALAMRNLTLLLPRGAHSAKLAAYQRVLLALTAKRKLPQDPRSQAALDAAVRHLQGILKDSPAEATNR